MTQKADRKELLARIRHLNYWVKLLGSIGIKHKGNCKILAQKLKEKAPELEDWLNANFGEYL